MLIQRSGAPLHSNQIEPHCVPIAAEAPELFEVQVPTHPQEPTSFLFVDNAAILVTGLDFTDTHQIERCDDKDRRADGMGENAQLYLWVGKIPIAGSHKAKSDRPSQAMEENPTTKTQPSSKWTNYKVGHNGQIPGTTH